MHPTGYAYPPTGAMPDLPSHRPGGAWSCPASNFAGSHRRWGRGLGWRSVMKLFRYNEVLTLVLGILLLDPGRISRAK